MKPPEPSLDYLREVLCLDPADELGALLQTRLRHRTGQSDQELQAQAPEDAARQAAEARELAEQELTELREQFWSLEPARLIPRLDALDLVGFPDLERGRKWLRRVADAHDPLEAAGQDPRVNGHFLEALKNMLVAPENERADLKRRALNAMKSANLRRAAAKSVKAFEKDYGQVFELESQWFQRVRGAKSWHKEHRRTGLALGWLGLYLAFRLVAWLLGKFD